MRALLEQLARIHRPTVGYHVSATKNRASIEAQGLVPDPMYAPGQGFVWFFGSLENARAKAPGFQAGGGANDIWEVDLRGLRIVRDPHDFRGYLKQGITAWATRDAVGPERLKRVE